MIYDLLADIIDFLNLPQDLTDVIWPIFPFIAIAALLVLTVLFLVLLERRVLAVLTIRKGPNRVGPFGLFQTIADAIKLLTKEDIMNEKANKILFTVAPVIFFAPVMVVYGLLPFSEKLLSINIYLGIVAVLAISSIQVLGILLAGWSSNNKYSLLGAMRAVSQSISYEIPLIMVLLAITGLAGSTSFIDIINAQKSLWFFVPCCLGFVIFFICMLAEINGVPFDLPEAESELVSGFNTEYSGMKFALFFLAEYASLFILSVLISILFLGGYLPPFGLYFSPENNVLVQLQQVFWLMAKTYTIIFVIFWIRATLPRVRSDQLSSFTWKFLLPLSILNLIFIAFYSFFNPIQ